MISQFLRIIENGLRIMSSNMRLLLVGVLVFIFPLLYVWSAQLFYKTAYDNIHTSQKQTVGMAHDAVAALLQNIPVQNFATLNSVLGVIAEQNSDITKFLVYQETEQGLLVIASPIAEQLNTYDQKAEAIRDLGFSNAHPFLQMEFIIDGKRVWQAYRRVPIDTTFYYIFSEHDFSLIDSKMTARQQESYLALTFILAFFMVLAYWLHRQTHWQKRYSELTETLHERDLFSNMIAHEFRSPLTAIKGYASFLEESPNLSNDERRFVGTIRQSTEHLVLLVSDFLEVARLQSGKLKIEKQDIDVRTVISTAVENLSGMAREKGLGLVFESGTKPIIFKTDKTRLLQVLTNLITNAIKYTPAGAVTLRCAEDYHAVVIRIMDTGTGISAEDQQKLFAPFTRVGGVDGTQITGTGLGMYITKQLVALLGGTIGVESIKNVGTHLVVTLKDS
jgi:signal transduction histidine kinase